MSVSPKIFRSNPPKFIYYPEDINLAQSGVYKLTFDNGYFYIGSTKNFKNRLSIYRTQFSGKNINPSNKKLTFCLINCISAKFEILEIIPDSVVYKEKETRFIKEHYGNELLINRSFCDVNTGVRWTAEERAKTSATMKEKYKNGVLKPTAHLYRDKSKPRKGKMVDMFDLNGSKINTFVSLSKAGEFIMVDGTTIKNYIEGVNKFKKDCKGYIFKYA